MSWKSRYRQKILRKKAAGVKRSVELRPVGNVREIGILWQGADREAFSFLTEYFQAQKIVLRSLCYCDKTETLESGVITRKSCNWLGFPQGDEVEAFVGSKLDLLINLSVTPCFPLEVVTALSHATFKIGWALSDDNWFDLSVDVTKRPEALYLAEQIILYIEQLTKKTTV